MKTQARFSDLTSDENKDRGAINFTWKLLYLTMYLKATINGDESKIQFAIMLLQIFPRKGIVLAYGIESMVRLGYKIE